MASVERGTGAVAAFQTWHYKYGQTSLWQTLIYQDREGNIRQLKDKSPSVENIIVPASRNPSRNGFALTVWGQQVEGFETLEVRVYWTNTDGRIFERCYSRNGGVNAVWYDGSLTGQYSAAPYSSIAANVKRGEETRVYFQEKETNLIREIYRAGRNTFDPFELMLGTRPAALAGTRIGANTSGGSREVYYQGPDLKWIVDGAAVSNFAPETQFEYAAGAPISVTGDTTSGAHIFTVNKAGRLVITTFDKTIQAWLPSVELVRTLPFNQIWANAHPTSTLTTMFPYGITAFVNQVQYAPEWITRVGYADPDKWDVVPLIL